MAGLLDLLKVEGAKYLRDILPGGLLNPEGAQIAPAVRKGAEEVRQGLLAYGAANKAALENPTWENVRAAVEGNMTAAGMAPLGMIVWHGSPHKFSKFDMSKIGTGEGAQMYGHGLYVAETPDVAKTYKNVGTDASYSRVTGGMTPMEEFAFDKVSQGVVGEDLFSAMHQRYGKAIKSDADFDAFNAAIKKAESSAGNLYKVDIPDEAVARFLDWDKTLSQQAPEVQAALERSKNKHLRSMIDYAKTPYSEAIGGEEKTMGEAFRLLNLNLQGKSSADSVKAAALLAKQGIPGIRYLDGGSRSGGQGSSNFVLFDDQMPRILEINGAPTGLQPWAKGEWRTLRGLLE